jgi:hypothetical protein
MKPYLPGKLLSFGVISGPALILFGCGGGTVDSPPSSLSTNTPVTTQTQSPVAVVPTAVPVTTYACDTSSSNNTCVDSIYALKTTLSTTSISQMLGGAYSQSAALNGASMACKQSSSCIPSYTANMSFSEIQALQRASSAVVRLTMPNDHVTDGQTYGIFFGTSCSGTVIRNTIDSSIYIATAAHCLYEAPLYPNVTYSSYRSSGIPIYVTFFYEKSTCTGTLDFSLFANYTVPAIPVAHNYSLAGLSAPSWTNISGLVTDFALLKLTSPLPPGVTPIAVSGVPAATTDTLFTFSHPYGMDKSGGYFDGGLVLAQTNGYQYAVSAKRRLTERGSSGGPLFAYKPNTNSLTLVGTQSGGSDPASNSGDVCNTSQQAVYGRLDRHGAFLSRYLGAL